MDNKAVTQFYNLSGDFGGAVDSALKVLTEGEIIAIPTDTVYGLAVDIYNQTAVENIYKLKGRNWSKPLTAFCSSINEIEKIAEPLPDVFYILADFFFPGPLTIIIKKRETIPSLVTAGLNTIGVRIPENDFVLEILEKFKIPLATTSANLSNAGAFDNAIDVLDTFSGLIPIIFDGGKCNHGKESTVIDISGDIEGQFPRLLREGVVSRESLESVLENKLF